MKVSKVIVDDNKCWKYIGDSLEEGVEFAQRVRAAGEKFYDPFTKKVTGVHKAVLDGDMVRLLIAMSHYHKYNDCGTMQYPDGFPILDTGVRGFTGEYAYLVHFGLLSRERQGDTTHYKLTGPGFEFVLGSTKVCPKLFNTGSQIHGYDETVERVNAQSFFSRVEWGLMQVPLWFLPQEYREEILTPEELEIRA
jgi:hypothetical protein